MSSLSIAPAAKPLRQYQLDAIAAVREAMRAGKRRVVLVIPTGGGKTRIGADIVRQAVARGSRVLWLAHRTELIDQTARTLIEYGLEVGVLAASSALPVAAGAPVQVASIQTLLARSLRPPAELIIWDEAHHASEGAEEWASLLDAYAGVRMLGLTATPERGDGKGLAPLFEHIVVGVTVRQLTEAGYLAPCEVVRPAVLLEPNHLAQTPLAAYRRAANGMQGFLFARTVAEATAYAAEFSAAGIPAVAISAGTKPAERIAALEMFRAGTLKILANVYIFTEGTDLPMAQVCILARGASSPGIYLQMVGRVLRPHAGKTAAMLIDLRGISHIHGMPEDERTYSLEGKAIALAESSPCKVCSAALPGGAYPCAACGYMPEAGEGDPVETEIDDVALVKFARKIAESREQRWETCVRWVRSAKWRGHKIGYVRHKWRAVYGAELPRSWVIEADRIVAGGAADMGAPHE